MIIIEGKSVFGGIAIGPIRIHQRKDKPVERHHVADAEKEISRYQDACRLAEKQLEQLYQKAIHEVGEANAAIFHVHQMMLSDMDYVEAAENMMRTQKINAEYAVAMTGDHFAALFEAMDDEYMRGRAADVKDVSARLIQILTGNSALNLDEQQPVILVKISPRISKFWGKPAP